MNVFIDGLYFEKIKGISSLVQNNALIFTLMEKDSNFICKNLVVENSDLNNVKIVSIGNYLT